MLFEAVGENLTPTAGGTVRRFAPPVRWGVGKEERT